MRNVSNDFKRAITEYGKQIDTRVTFDTGQTVTSSSLISVKLNTEGAWLDACMREVEILLYAGGYTTIGKVINSIQLGVDVNGRFEYIDYGKFYVTDTKFNDEDDTWEIHAYDPMVRFMTDYALHLDYSEGITVKGLLNAICDVFDVECGTDTFYNADQLIDEEKYLDGTYTYRSVLAEIAQCAGGTIAFKPDGKLYVLYPFNTAETINTNNMRTFQIGEDFGEVNSIVIARTPQEDNIYIQNEASIEANGLCEIKIENNQIMDSHREDFLEGLSSALMGLLFTEFSFDTFGYCYYDLMDRIYVSGYTKPYEKLIVLNDSIEISQGITETISCKRPDETETDYKYASTTDRVVNQTILRVDKQDQQITAFIRRTEQLEGVANNNTAQITHMSQMMMDAESVNIAISTAIGNIDEVTTSTGYTFNADGLTITKQGEEMETTIDNTGMYVKQNGSNILTANNVGVDAVNIKVNQYLVIGDNSRLEDYMSNRTACFYIGGEL